MKKQLATLGFGLVTAASMALSSGNAFAATQPPKTASIRFVHAIAGGPKVEVKVDGKMAQSSLAFRQVGRYIEVTPGQHQLEMVEPGNNKSMAVISTTVMVDAGKMYTAIAAEDKGKPALTVLDDTTAAPAKGMAVIRLINLNPKADRLDVSAAEAKTTTNTKPAPNAWFSNIEYLKVGVFTAKATGKYDLSYTVNNGAKPAHTQVLAPKTGDLYTLFAFGPESAKSSQLLVVHEQVDKLPQPASK